jgi:coproporphyrinogen III oxidase
MSITAQSSPMPNVPLDEKKHHAEAWFRQLRNTICAAFEAIEQEYAAHREDKRGAEGEPQSAGVAAASSEASPKKFSITPWQREAGGGGEIGMMKGRVFEKVGVNISTVHGEFAEAFRKEIPGAAEDPRFWASGISLVAHPANPHVPAAHMNTRMICVGEGARLWFGGGGDLNPALPIAEDTAAFHQAFRQVCDAVDVSFYPDFSDWCESYFFLPHRNAARGVGGIFYDYLGLHSLGSINEPVATGRFGKGGLDDARVAQGMARAANTSLNWAEAYAFTQSVGETFRECYSAIVRKRMHRPFTAEEKHAQLVYRGRYAEYNLLYDRGTRFGLMTGGNPEAILMSLPPEAKWD